MHEPQARREHRFDADRAIFGFRERQPFGFDVLRIMVGDDDVDQPFAERANERLALVLMAQRRSQLQEGAIVADVVLVQRQMIDRGPAGDGQALVLGAAQRVQRQRRR